MALSEGTRSVKAGRAKTAAEKRRMAALRRKLAQAARDKARREELTTRPKASASGSSKQARPTLGAARAQKLRRMGVGPSGFSIGRALANLARQTRDAPSDLGPALASVARAIGSDVKAEFDPGEPDRDIFAKDPKRRPRTVEEVVKPAKEGLEYLASRGPVLVRYDEKGRPVYRAKTGGETLDERLAKRGIIAKVEEGPLDYLLIAAAAPTAGGSAVVQGARLPVIGSRVARFAQPGERVLRARTGEEVRQSTSRNPSVRGQQKIRRKLSTGLTGAVENRLGAELPVVGEHARAVRLADKQNRRRERADIGRVAAPFDRAVRKLKGGEKIALVLRAQGVPPSELRGFVEERLAKARADADAARGNPKRVKALRGEVKDHERMLRILAHTSDETFRRVDTDPKLRAAYAEATKLADAGGDILEHLNLIDSASRALRPYLTARVVRGARWETGRKRRRAERRLGRTEALAARQERVVGAVRDRFERSEQRTRPLTIAEAEKAAPAAERKFRKLVEARAAGLMPANYRAEVLYRNRENRKRARKGWPAKPTLKQETLAAAERDVEEMLRASKHPAAQRVLAELDEARRIREGMKQIRGRPDSILPEEAIASTKATAKVRREVLGTRKAEKNVRLEAVLQHEERRLRKLEGRKASAAEAVGKEPPEGFVGGPSIEGLKKELGELVYFGHVGSKLREGQVPLARSGAAPPQKPSLAKRNRAVRLMTSRWLPTPDAWRDSFVKAIAYAHARSRGEFAFRVSRPLNPDGSKNKGWYYVRLDAAKPSKAARERGDLERDMDEFLGDDRDLEGYLRDTLVSDKPEDLARWFEKGEEFQVGQISPADYRAIFGDMKVANRFVRNFLDRPTDFWRALTLSYRPAWVVNNFVGQTLLYAVNHASPAGAAAYAMAVADEARSAERYFPEDLRMGFFRSEARQTGASGPPATVRAGNALRTAVNAERSMRDRIGRVNAALSDNVPRRAAWYAVADRHRQLLNRLEKTNTTFDEFLTELRKAAEDPTGGSKRLRRLHDDLVQEVLDELIDFQNLSHFERSALRRAIPFYSWLKGITLATGRLAYEHPAKVELMNLLATEAEHEGERRFGEGQDVLRGLYPLGEAVDRGRGPEQDFLSTRGLNPYETVASISGMARGGVSRRPDSPFDNPANALNPIVQALAETMFRRDLFSGERVEAPGGQPGIFARQLLRSFPQASVVERSVFPEQPVSGNRRARLTVPDASYRLPGTDVSVPGPVLGYLGAPLTRKNVARAQDIHEERKREAMKPASRVRYDVGKERQAFFDEAKRIGWREMEDGRLPEWLRQAFVRRAERFSAYAGAKAKKGTDITQHERYAVDLALLVRWGRLGARAAQARREWARSVNAEEIERARDSLSSKHFDELYLKAIRKARARLRDAGAKLDPKLGSVSLGT